MYKPFILYALVRTSSNTPIIILEVLFIKHEILFSESLPVVYFHGGETTTPIPTVTLATSQPNNHVHQLMVVGPPSKLRPLILNVYCRVCLLPSVWAQCDCCLSILKSLPNPPTLVQIVFVD